MSDIFKGFSSGTFQFLRDLEANNNREWFEENREVYEEVLFKPLKNFVIHLSPAMSLIDTKFELTPHRAMSRIYRDVRFSHDKSPYKTHMWVTFQQVVDRYDWGNYPGYYISLSAEGLDYGMGLGQPKRAIMDDVRDHITYRAEEFKEETQKIFDRNFELNGEKYKRLIPSDLSEYYQEWIQRKALWIEKSQIVDEIVYSDKIASYLLEEFKSLEWLYNFFKQSQP